MQGINQSMTNLILQQRGHVILIEFWFSLPLTRDDRKPYYFMQGIPVQKSRYDGGVGGYSERRVRRPTHPTRPPRPQSRSRNPGGDIMIQEEKWESPLPHKICGYNSCTDRPCWAIMIMTSPQACIPTKAPWLALFFPLGFLMRLQVAWGSRMESRWHSPQCSDRVLTGLRPARRWKSEDLDDRPIYTVIHFESHRQTLHIQKHTH